MLSVKGVSLGVVERNDLPGLANLVTDRSFELQLTSGHQAQSDAVLDSASNPAPLSHARNSREPHACQPAQGVQHIRYEADLLDGLNISR
jgi:hypothetical protein